ncbi:A disintegrin and metalloproteinase with thrombospondin motifs 18-like [Plakobranchus ocellatus]|uniref:A disintegrin and metalloproteinase with thrombospondin motifs 18-like n=1 Tax=Plakobranchus ocellatus TaxID=259542 RepID=A0AAV4DCZ4_9GAST|nr:A disintegrin and metalloproteinase with thrombospondin motifs 18-like [Plakobranchus ocellatus]
MYDWIPWNPRGAQECHLMCQSRPNDRIYRRTLDGSKNFKDGTSCVGDQHLDFYRCVHGHCEAISCDGHSDSVYKFDKCGVCGGRGNTCSRRSGVKTQGQPQAVTVAGKPVFNGDLSKAASSDTYSKDGITVHYRKAVGELEEQLEVRGPLQVEAEAQARFEDKFYSKIITKSSVRTKSNGRPSSSDQPRALQNFLSHHIRQFMGEQSNHVRTDREQGI